MVIFTAFGSISGKIFIGGLKPEVTDEMLKEFFGKFGKITDFEMPVDKKTQLRKGFGFITFEREEPMKQLIQKRNVIIGEHTVDLRKATPKPDRMAGGGGWGAGAMGYGGPGENLLFVSTLSSVTCLFLPFSHLGLIRSKVKVALLYGKVSVGDREKAVPVVKG